MCRARPTRRVADRPADAASLLILDGRGTDARVLMGRRSAAHAFMPEVYVFPGGRVDAGDRRRSTTGALRPADEARLLSHTARPSPARARAMAVAALREAREETGVAIGAVEGDALVPHLTPLRYVARAITPPGRSRRFDARFFACQRDDITGEDAPTTDELEDVRWVPLADAKDAVPLARITAVIIDEMLERLGRDPDLTADLPVPRHRMLHRRFVRDEH